MKEQETFVVTPRELEDAARAACAVELIDPGFDGLEQPFKDIELARARAALEAVGIRCVADKPRQRQPATEGDRMAQLQECQNCGHIWSADPKKPRTHCPRCQCPDVRFAAVVAVRLRLRQR